MPEFSCDVYGTVDFGEGPVKVRCTRTGDHENHICQVFLEDRPIRHQNVFDKKD